MGGLDLASFSDIGSLIEGKSLDEQLNTLKDMFGILDIEPHEGSDDGIFEKLENTFYVADGSGKEGIFIKDIGLLSYGDFGELVDRVRIEKHNLEFSNIEDQDYFHLPFIYVRAENNRLNRVFHFHNTELVPVGNKHGNFDFLTLDEAADVLGEYKANIHISQERELQKRMIRSTLQ